MNRKQLSQKVCQFSSALEDCTDGAVRQAGKHHMNMMSQKFQESVLNDLGIASLVRCHGDFYDARRKLARDYPRLYMQHYDLWHDLANAIALYRNERRINNIDPMSCHHSFLRNAVELSRKQLPLIDTRPKLYLPKIVVQLDGRAGTNQFNDRERVIAGGAQDYWDERVKRFDMSKTRVTMFLEYKPKAVTQRDRMNDSNNALVLPLTWGHQVKRLGIASLENKIVCSAEPCMTTEVHGAIIEGFRAVWYKLDRKSGWTTEEGYIAKCDDMYRTCKSRMHISNVGKREVAQNVTNELLDALG